MLLQNEFPLLRSYNLPSYNISYPKNGNYLISSLFLQVPSIILTIRKEKKILAKIIEKEHIDGIISDNRFGVYHAKIPSVYITHQLRVLSGFTTFFTTKIHQKIYEKFNEIWVPDIYGKSNFSGELSSTKLPKEQLKFIGVLSRFKLQKLPLKYNILVVLSGIEPQRTLLENKLLNELKHFNGKVLFIRGVFSEKEITASSNIMVKNHLLSHELEQVINESDLVIARSGYSTIMDMAVLGKKTFFIPTTGQKEQEYLAELMDFKKISPYSKQEDFNLNELKKVKKYHGFQPVKTTIHLELFQLFNSK